MNGGKKISGLPVLAIVLVLPFIVLGFVFFFGFMLLSLVIGALFGGLRIMKGGSAGRVKVDFNVNVNRGVVVGGRRRVASREVEGTGLLESGEVEIGEYVTGGAVLQAWDGDAVTVARLVAERIAGGSVVVGVEHVGSTAVAGCGGKGVVDLAVLYDAVELEVVKEMLRGMGFQRQPHADPFAESRPMLVGSVEYGGRWFGVHVHVLEKGCAEAVELVRFRDRLREDGELAERYVRVKKEIVDSGVTDSLEYCRRKGRFIDGL